VKVGLLHRFDRGTATSAPALEEFATVAEDCGVESLWVGEHVAVAADYAPRYPYSPDGRMTLPEDTVLPDPLEWLSFLAAVTRRVRLGTGTIVLPVHQPVMLAKRVATLDALSGGRVLLGVGLGWQAEEHEALGVAYADRGARADEAIVVLRRLWGEEEATYAGRFTRFDRLRSDPKPVAGAVPILVGGSSLAAARRAGRLGDEWFPSSDLTPEAVATRMGVVRRAAVEAGRDPEAIGLTVRPTMSIPGAVFDRDRVQRYADAGATRVVISAAETEARGPEALRRLLETYFERVVARLT
jgi:probable F420-dependent oxidoreductase